MEQMLAVIRQELLPDELVRGECIIYERHEDEEDKEKITSLGLIVCCPRCGKSSTGKHVYDPKTKSLHPSIVCNSINDNGVKCNYHGWLKNGIFSNL